ncbi:hypothetical protein GCM10023322_79010 [Rugosimonospora acidiphila]|uniref:Uncharacterized protein n=1 Tax=Rugosimonospora acidiphila TaxID=556531 RepID=A0ABP9SQ80_9ACTN
MSDTPTDTSTTGTPDRDGITYPHVRVQLTGQDGNAYFIIGRVAAAIRAQVSAEAATQFTQQAQASASYDDLLYLVMCTVDVH